MCRIAARVLSVSVLVGVALSAGGSAVAADPAAEVSPGSASPGGSVTVSVSCDAGGGQAAESIDATSQAFDEGTASLRLVTGNEDPASGPAYRGTARIAPAGDFEGAPLSKHSAWTVDGTCPGAHGGQEKQWSATFTVSVSGGSDGGRECVEPRTESCEAAVIQRGVRAGEGGAFTGSVPALVAGGVLIAGALGGAAYRVRRRGPGADA